MSLTIWDFITFIAFAFIFSYVLYRGLEAWEILAEIGNPLTAKIFLGTILVIAILPMLMLLSLLL